MGEGAGAFNFGVLQLSWHMTLLELTGVESFASLKVVLGFTEA